MGYTHYFDDRPKIMDAEIFRKASDECKKVVESLDIPLADVKFTDDVISFNGVGDDGHEDFELSRIKGNYFDFCKTARKPYDLAVCCCLLILEKYFDGTFIVRSDGDKDGGFDGEGWDVAREKVALAIGQF